MKKMLLTVFSLIFSLLVFPAYGGGVSEARKLQNTFAAVAEKSFPAVVVIEAHRAFQPPMYGRPSSNSAMRGSGFIISKDGYIVTNNHVVADSSRIIVSLKNGTRYKAKLVGTDNKTDIAVLKIKSEKNLPFLKFTDSDKVKVGHWAIAIGAPFNLDYSMTVGIVSQKGRAVGMNIYENYIQTDASINPGNSGGPLLGLDGKVIGVNNFIISNRQAPGNIGLGFAIPSNMAKHIAEELMKTGKVSRPWLGISMYELTDELQKKFGEKSGVLVSRVFRGEPAHKAGVKVGDIVKKIGTKKVNSPRELQFAILSYKPGDEIPLSITRDGKPLTVTVIAGRQMADKMASDTPGANGANYSVLFRLGIMLSEKKNGVYIRAVTPGSPADTVLKLRPGIRIIQINRVNVKTITEAEKAAAMSKKHILLYIDTGNGKMFLALTNIN